MNDYEKVIVLGAGITGLSAARTLAINNVPVTVIEKEVEPGGLSATLRLNNNFLFDYGPHNFHTPQSEVIDYYKELVPGVFVERKLQVKLFIFGKLVSYVLSVASFYAKLSVVMPYAIPHANYPGDINADLAALHKSVEPSDKKALDDSWDPDKLYPLYLKYFSIGFINNSFPSFIVPLDKANSKDLNKFGTFSRAIYIRTISENPQVLPKWFWTNGVLFFSDWTALALDYQTALKQVYDYFYASVPRDRRAALHGQVYKDVVDIPASNRGYQITESQHGSDIEFRHTAFAGIVSMITSYIAAISRDRYYFMLSLAMLPVALLLLIRERGAHFGAAVYAMIVTLHIGAGFLVAMFGAYVDRYPAPTKFSLYSAFFLIPLLFFKTSSHKASQNSETGQCA